MASMNAIRIVHQWPIEADAEAVGLVRCEHCAIRTTGFIISYDMLPACSDQAARCPSHTSYDGHHAITFATSPEAQAALIERDEYRSECVHCGQQWRPPVVDTRWLSA